MRKIRSTNYWRIGFIFLILTLALEVAPTPAVDDGANLAEQFLKLIFDSLKCVLGTFLSQVTEIIMCVFIRSSKCSAIY